MRTSYPPDLKAQAITALLVGGRPRVVAREYGIPESTVTTWRWRLKHGKLRHEKKDGRPTIFGELLMHHLETSLRSLIAQSERLSDPGVLKEMRAGELGVYFGVVFDRTIRITELLPALEDSRGEGYKL